MDAIAWDTAEQVAIRVAGREPLAESYHYASLEPDFREFTAEAEALVEAETGLKSLAGPARARVTDRAGWIRANLASFQRLLRPLTDRLGEQHGRHQGRPDRPPDRRGRGRRPPRAGCRPGCSASTTCSSSRTRTPTTRTSSTTWAPTSWPWRSATASRPGSSACGWPCTRSPTARSSPACRGCGRTSSPWSTRAWPTFDPDPKRLIDVARAGRRRGPRRPQPPRRGRHRHRCWPRPSSRSSSSASAA